MVHLIHRAYGQVYTMRQTGTIGINSSTFRDWRTMSDKKPVSGHRAGPETQVSYVPGTWGSEEKIRLHRKRFSGDKCYCVTARFSCYQKPWNFGSVIGNKTKNTIAKMNACLLFLYVRDLIQQLTVLSRSGWGSKGEKYFHPLKSLKSK